MDIEIVENTETKTFLFRGDINLSSSIRLEKELHDFIDNDTRNAIIDLKEVARIDSLSLAIFMKSKTRLLEKNRTFKLINVNTNIIRVIELASLELFLLGD